MHEHSESDDWACDAVLRDGATVHLRALQPNDRAALNDLHERCSQETHYRRFLNCLPHLPPKLLDQLSVVDQENRVAIVAESGAKVIAVGRYDRLCGTTEAEVAFTVDDAEQHRGLGSLLFDHLVVVARGRGIERFVATVLAENQPMLDVFRKTGYPMRSWRADPAVAVLDVALEIQPVAAAMAACRERDRVATVASVRRLFEPESIAVIGASEHPGSPGHQVMVNLLRSGFRGPVLPVNPHAEFICGLPVVPSVTDAPYAIDLAVIVVPATAVEDVVAECARCGVQALVIISAGFAESGLEGAARQRRVLHLARRNGMRIVGPNCFGIANTAPDVAMNVTFASAELAAGSVAVMTQSGAVGIAVLDGLAHRGLGVSSFASVGNKADVSGNDLVTYWEQDAATRQIVLYLESFGNPLGFARIAPRVSRLKPVLAIKSGRSEAAAGAAFSHTAALALPDDSVDALLHQAGVLRVDDVEELLDLCVALDSQPLPAGRRVAIVTNAGGQGVLAADTCAACGLVLAQLATTTSAAVDAALGRPLVRASADSGLLDLRADAPPEALGEVLRAVLADPGVDALVVVSADVSGADAHPFANAITAVQLAAHNKPMLCSFVPESNRVLAPGLATFTYPERAVRALARLVERAEWLAQRSASEPVPDIIGAHAIRALVNSAMTSAPAGGWMPLVDAFRLVELAGIATSMPVRVDTADDACEAAAIMGYPVVLKVADPDVMHKSDNGGVKVGLHNDFEIAAAFAALERHFEIAVAGVLVQPMCPPGIELLAGIVNRRELGPVIVVGEGGRLAELRHDRAVRMPPIDVSEAMRQLGSLRISALLDGLRGGAVVNRMDVAEVLVRLARIAEFVPEIATLDINPLIVAPNGICAVDVKIRLEPVAGHSPDRDRRLRE